MKSMMKRNLVYVRVGDNSLHASWVVPRAKRNYDLFISYFGANPGTFQNDGEYYEAVSGLKLPAFARLLKERPEFVYSYDAIWIPDDDLLTHAGHVSRMFDLFHKYKLHLAQPALSSGSYLAHPITAMRRDKSLHFSRHVEVMCPLFSRVALKKLARTFRLSASSWGLDFLWAHRLGYPRRRIAILDETPVVHTRPIGKGAFYDALKGQKIDPEAESQKILKKYRIDADTVRTRVFGSISASKAAKARASVWTSLHFLQVMMDKDCKSPIFYENRTRKLKLKNTERPDFSSHPELVSDGFPLETNGREAARLKRLMTSNRRLRLVAKDFMKHWAVRQKMREGKAMMVCMDQQVARKMFKILSQLQSQSVRQETVALADLPPLSSEPGKPSAITQSQRAIIARFKDPRDPLKVIIIDDIRRLDFDCPLINTLYVDVPKPIEEHHALVRRLMRIFQNRLATLVVDYVGLSDAAFQTTESAPSQKPVTSRSSQTGPMKVFSSGLASRTTIKLPLGRRPSLEVGESRRESGNAIESGRRIAHLFLVRSNLNHDSIWERFFQGHERQYNIYVHAKHPEEVTSRLLRGKHIARRCETMYGHVSLVKAELLLLREALKNKENGFFLLHSESCVPIRSFEFLYRQLFETGRSRLFSFKGDMWRYYGIKPAAVQHRFFFKSSQFFCLTRDHAESVLAEGKLAHWKRCECADEHYFPTVLATSGKLSECLRQPLTFADWNRKRRESGWGPTTYHKLSPGDLKNLMDTEAFFARKFAPDSDISDYIDALHARSDDKVTAKRATKVEAGEARVLSVNAESQS